MLSTALGSQLRRAWPLAVGVGGGLLLLERSQGALSSLVSLSAAAAGLWLLSGRLRPSGRSLPSSVDGWLERCQSVLESFDRLDLQGDPHQQRQRRQKLELIRQRQSERHLEVALVGCAGWSEMLQAQVLQHCAAPLPLRLLRSHPLPPSSENWRWPEAFRRCDLIVYRLNLPLKASDLRWLEALPQGQPVLVLVDRPADNWQLGLRQLELQLPEHLRSHCWPWSPQRADQLGSDLQPLAEAFAALNAERRRLTQQRCLEDLHTEWQVALESLRRSQWQRLLQRTQWTVAAGVVVAPLPSLDLLVLAAANGLMLQDMARLWECPWSLEQLQAAALHLAKACLSLGVVEWSSQALAGLVKLHGATWLVGGALQALSAAYLTRVVGRAMADYMALAAGVPEHELERLLQQQAPLLVARAAEQEKLDWAGFVQQSQQWLQQQLQPQNGTTALP
ncbi:YcjF family protein [Vulcanococcus sp.]|uniref:YcjF family protein n=1 Tax=Vulcanococcus sp. TaxID=2856995 RepID=UPI003F6A3DA5